MTIVPGELVILTRYSVKLIITKLSYKKFIFMQIFVGFLSACGKR